MYAGSLFRCEKQAADLMKKEMLKNKKVQLPWWNYRFTALFLFFFKSLNLKRTLSFELQKEKKKTNNNFLCLLSQ